MTGRKVNHIGEKELEKWKTEIIIKILKNERSGRRRKGE